VTTGPPALLAKLAQATSAAESLYAPGGVVLDGETSVLGWPRHGDGCVGQLGLVELSGDAGRCEVASVMGSIVRGSPWIAVLPARQTGQSSACRSLAELTRQLQSIAPLSPCGAVFVQDPAVEQRLPEIDPGRDDLAVAAIPSLKLEGNGTGGELVDMLYEAVAAGGLAGGVAGELRWGLTTAAALKDGTTPVEFWASPLDSGALSLLQQLATSLRPLRRLLRPVARWHLRLEQNMPHSFRSAACVATGEISNLTAQVGGVLCMPSGDAEHQEAYILAQLQEIGRQKCLRERHADSPEALWEYIERVLVRCGSVEASGLESCSGEQLQALDLNEEAVLRCSRERLAELLREEIERPGPGVGGNVGMESSLEVRIGGWAYGGAMEAELLFAAICSVASRPPAAGGAAACGDVWHWRDPRWFVYRVSMWPQGFLVLAASFMAPMLSPLLWAALKSSRALCRTAGLGTAVV
ncbi:unnamed protein product, partial [Polarella glacialis]